MAEIRGAVTAEREIPRLLNAQNGLVTEIQDEVKRLFERCGPITTQLKTAAVNGTEPDGKDVTEAKAETSLGATLDTTNRQLSGIINALRDLRMSIEL